MSVCCRGIIRVHDHAIIHMYMYSLSSQLELQIGNSATLETAVSSYFELCDVCLRLEKSLCTNLKHLALSLKNHWCDRLRETLSKYVCLSVCVVYCIRAVLKIKLHAHVCIKVDEIGNRNCLGYGNSDEVFVTSFSRFTVDNIY